MRILYFTRDYTTHDRRFLIKMAESRHEIWFLRLEDDGVGYEKRPLPDGVRAAAWPGGTRPSKTPSEWLAWMPHYQSVLDRVRPDLVHAGPVQSCGFMTAIADFHPFLVMSWGSDILVDANRDELWRWITLYTLSRSDALACDCEEVSHQVRQLVSYSRDRIVQFPWGIDLSTFSPGPDTLQLRAREAWQDAFLILSTRLWEPNYGTEVLLEAFRLAYCAEPRLRLVLLGDGSLAPWMRRYLDEHGLMPAVHLAGMVPHSRLPEYFRAADLYISCAPSDGTSISLLEAMATGLPVVVIDRPSNREWITPGKNGWLAPAGSSTQIADAFLSAARLDSVGRRQISAANRWITEQRADWEKNFAKLLAAYERLECYYGRKPLRV